MKPIFVVIPTWKNEKMCGEAIRTLFEYTEFDRFGKLLLIDNSPNHLPTGSAPESDHLKAICAKYGVEYFTSGENLGWMRSINLAFERSTAPFFCMCNDDVVFPQDPAFWSRTLELFDNPHVGGVGPTSNYVMGHQFFRGRYAEEVGEVNLLIGFCVVYRADILAAIGTLDASLPGGDDLDMSIRVRAEGYKLLCDRRSFLFHYGSVTGNRVHNDWDSHQSQLKTANAIIRKHGMVRWHSCVLGPWIGYHA